MQDTKIRSVVKGVSWRLVGTFDTFVLAYLIFGSAKVAAPIAFTEVLTKIILYFFHERLWNVIPWGRGSNKPRHIRSFTKGVSWRLLGSIDTVVISFFISGNGIGAFKLGGTEIITKVILYYLHERLWANIRWGRVFDPTPVSIKG